MGLRILGFILILAQFSLAMAAKPIVVAKPKVPAKETAKLQYTAEAILKQILIKKNVQLKPEVPMPKIYMASKTPLKQFQDAIEPQWGFRPASITNAFIFLKNEIYMSDDAAYYKKMKRCIDDSLAHELTHYLQVMYFNYDTSDESLETEAVDVQTWFRENFCKIK